MLLGFDEAQTPHLRVEHRVMPAGPSIADMIANAAVYLGGRSISGKPARRTRSGSAIRPGARQLLSRRP
jgi:hypothetical protein